MRILLISMTIALLAAGTAVAQGDPYGFHRPGPDATRQAYFAEVRMEANQLLGHWQDAWNTQQTYELAKLYTPRATYWPADAPRVETRDAIRDRFTAALAAGNEVEMRLADFGTSGDLAYVTVRSVYSGAKGTLVCTELLLLRRGADNHWQIEMHIARPEPDERAVPPVAQ